MAERFGGKYSPGGTGSRGQVRAPAARRSRAGMRANLLFAVPFLFLIPAFGSDPVGLALYLLAFGALQLAAWLTREGLIAEDAFDARAIAKRPAIPRKIFGSLMTGIGLGLAGVASDQGAIVGPAIFATLGATLHFMSFGSDPLKDKGVEAVVFEPLGNKPAQGDYMSARKAGIEQLEKKLLKQAEEVVKAEKDK